MASLNPALKDFWLTPARVRVLFGGRASSKSWDAAGFAIFLAQHCKIKVLCTRQFQNRIDDSVYTLLKLQIERFGLSWAFKITNNSIICTITGSEFIFYGLARNIREIKSLTGVDVCWIEEAEGLTKEQWDVLRPTVREDGSQFWVVFNPRLVNDFSYQRFVVSPPENAIVRKINYDENPFLSQTMIDEILATKRESEDDFLHIYQGFPLVDDDDAVIKMTWIDAALDAHKKLGIEPSGKRSLGFDVADSGIDLCGTVARHGFVAYFADEWKAGEHELLLSCSRAFSNAEEFQAQEIIYDCIGVGAFAGARFVEIEKSKNKGGMAYKAFNAGAGVSNPDGVYTRARGSKIKNKDFFSNIKAQMWWLLADRFRNTYNAVCKGATFSENDIIAIDTETMGKKALHKLQVELSSPRRSFDENGKVKVESKKDMKKRNVASPNIADALVMAFAGNVASSSPMRVNQSVVQKVMGVR